MPPRGYRDESKALKRAAEEGRRELIKAVAECLRWDALNTPEMREQYRRSLQEERCDREFEAFRKARSYKGEPDLVYLVRIASMTAHEGITPYAAAGKVAYEIWPEEKNARYRHAAHQRLYDKFRKAPILYYRLAALAPELALDDPAYLEAVKSLDFDWFKQGYTWE